MASYTCERHQTWTNILWAISFKKLDIIRKITDFQTIFRNPFFWLIVLTLAALPLKMIRLFYWCPSRFGNFSEILMGFVFRMTFWHSQPCPMLPVLTYLTVAWELWPLLGSVEQVGRLHCVLCIAIAARHFAWLVSCHNLSREEKSVRRTHWTQWTLTDTVDTKRHCRHKQSQWTQ